MKDELKSYILFPSHTDGLALEKILKLERINYTIVPTPRELSKCCGIAIMTNPDNIEDVNRILNCNPDIKIEGIETIIKKKRNWFK